MSASVGTQQEFNAAIVGLENASAGQYTITVTAGFMFDDAGIPGTNAIGLYAIDLPAGVSLTIARNNAILEGNGEGSGIAVVAGKVTIQSLTIEDTLAQGGNGLGGLDGGDLAHG